MITVLQAFYQLQMASRINMGYPSLPEGFYNEKFQTVRPYTLLFLHSNNPVNLYQYKGEMISKSNLYR